MVFHCAQAANILQTTMECASDRGTVVLTEYFNRGLPDFRSLLTKIQREKPDAIYTGFFYEDGANFLKRIDGGAFETTNESGEPLYGKGGSISGSSLEASNTDIADEFTKLIVTQQAYSANTKVITTANTMVQDLLNVMR